MSSHPQFMSLLLLAILSVLTVVVNGQHFEKSKSVWIEQGLVRGRIYKLGDKRMQMFRGIPYAEPPIGELRFRKPVKRGRWHRELTALDYGAPCIQFMDFHKNDKYAGENMKRESEDCLFLNVFAPYDPADETSLHPVLVWIHGGSFLAGSGDTGIDMEVTAKNLIFKGIVLVTINYRLGPLGFISTRGKDGKFEGNFGIWDQVLALEWVQANIKQFNGDPDHVTIMGESAGAASVSVLALSPVTEGIVHQAIIMSGSATAGWAIHRHGVPEWDVANVAAYLRCEKKFNPVDMAEIIKANPEDYRDDEDSEKCNMQGKIPDCLEEHTTNEEKLLQCFRNELNFTSFLFRKGLTVELGVSKMVVDGELIPMAGVEFVKNYSRIPVLIGVANREWSHKKPLFYGFKKYENLTNKDTFEKVRMIVDGSFHKTVNGKLPNATLNLIGNATYYRYMESQSPNETWELSQFVRRLQDLEADIEFVAPCQLEIDAYAENGHPVYAYSFDYVPQSPITEDEQKTFNLFGMLTDVRYTKKVKFDEAFHGLDHAYIFTNGYSSNFQIDPFTNRDSQMSRMICSMISNFVKKGDPTPKPWNGFTWQQYKPSSPTYAQLNVPPKELNGELHWPTPTFWNKHVRELTRYTAREGELAYAEVAPLTKEERLQLNAYKRAWWALWLLVAVIAVVLWTVIICLVVKKCTSPRAKPYDNIVVSNNR